MAYPFFISDIVTQRHKGQIQIHSFQRDFDLDADRVVHLTDRIYNGYPFGVYYFGGLTNRFKPNAIWVPSVEPGLETD